MNFKKRYIIILFIVLIAFVIVYFYLINKNKITLQTNGQKITINNIISGQKVVNDRITMKDTSDYIISLYKPDMLFGIMILNKDIWNTRIAAENDLLKILNISKNDACELSLELYVWDKANEKVGGTTNYGLSFCPNGIVFPK